MSQGYVPDYTAEIEATAREVREGYQGVDFFHAFRRAVALFHAPGSEGAMFWDRVDRADSKQRAYDRAVRRAENNPLREGRPFRVYIDTKFFSGNFDFATRDEASAYLAKQITVATRAPRAGDVADEFHFTESFVQFEGGVALSMDWDNAARSNDAASQARIPAFASEVASEEPDPLDETISFPNGEELSIRELLAGPCTGETAIVSTTYDAGSLASKSRVDRVTAVLDLRQPIDSDPASLASMADSLGRSGNIRDVTVYAGLAGVPQARKAPALCAYEVELTWNGQTVCVARMSAVCAADVVEAFFRDQFVGRVFAGWKAHTFEGWSTRVLNMPCGSPVSLHFGDETGQASATITRAH